MWSLHVEEQFYLIFPLLVRRLRIRQLERVLISAVVAAPLIRWGLLWLFPVQSLLQYMLLPCRMDALALGAIVAIRWPALEPPSGRKLSVVLATLGFLFVAYHIFRWAGGEFNTPFERTIGYSLFDLAFMGCLILILIFRGRPGTAWLNWRPLQYIGMISYGLYLFQEPAASLVSRMVLTMTGWPAETVRTWGDTVFGALCIAGTCIGLATISWYLWETRWLRLKSRFVRGHELVRIGLPGTPLKVNDP